MTPSVGSGDDWITPQAWPRQLATSCLPGLRRRDRQAAMGDDHRSRLEALPDRAAGPVRRAGRVRQAPRRIHRRSARPLVRRSGPEVVAEHQTRDRHAASSNTTSNRTTATCRSASSPPQMSTTSTATFCAVAVPTVRHSPRAPWRGSTECCIGPSPKPSAGSGCGSTRFPTPRRHGRRHRRSVHRRSTR